MVVMVKFVVIMKFHLVVLTQLILKSIGSTMEQNLLFDLQDTFKKGFYCAHYPKLIGGLLKDFTVKLMSCPALSYTPHPVRFRKRRGFVRSYDLYMCTWNQSKRKTIREKVPSSTLQVVFFQLPVTKFEQEPPDSESSTLQTELGLVPGLCPVHGQWVWLSPWFVHPECILLEDYMLQKHYSEYTFKEIVFVCN